MRILLAPASLSRRGALVALACAAALAAPSTAQAHLHTGTVATDYGGRVTAPVASPAFSAGVYLSDLALHVRVRPGHTLVVLGYLGEPFLRIGPAGVSVNAGSPTAAASRLLPTGKPSGHGWLLEPGRTTAVWHDGRVQGLPRDRGRASWRVPVIVDGRRTSIAGQVWRDASPDLALWLVLAGAAAAAGLALTLRRSAAQVCVALGVGSAACAIVAAAGFSLDSYASAGTWIEAADELCFAAAGAALLVWGPSAARAAAGGGLGILAIAAGLSKGAIFLHPIVLSALPAAASRVLVALAVGAGTTAAALACLVYARLDAAAEARSYRPVR